MCVFVCRDWTVCLWRLWCVCVFVCMWRDGVCVFVEWWWCAYAGRARGVFLEGVLRVSVWTDIWGCVCLCVCVCE